MFWKILEICLIRDIRLLPSPDEFEAAIIIRFMEAGCPTALGYAGALTLVLCFVAISFGFPH